MINTDAINEKVKEITADVFERALSEIGEELLCGFALYTDESAMTLLASINTQEHFEKISTERPENRVHYLFSTPEWKQEDYQASLLDEINEDLSEVYDELLEDEDDQNFEKFSSEFFEGCVRALESLKPLKPPGLNENFVLVFVISDYGDTEKAIGWIERLNGPQKSAEFAKLMRSF